MGNVLVNSLGNVITSGGNAFEVTSNVDANIVAGNIKKDVTILGVTGTYEGSGGGGSADTTFYDATFVSASSSSSLEPGPMPGLNNIITTFTVEYPNNNNKVPDMFIVYDLNSMFTPISNGHIKYLTISSTQDLNDAYFGGTLGLPMSITSQTSTITTFKFNSFYGDTLDVTKFLFAPIYLST